MMFGLWLPASMAYPQAKDDWQNSPEAQRFEQRVEAARAELIRINGPGTDKKLKAELLAMRDSDQGIRDRILTLPNAQQKTLKPRLERTDARLTAELKGIVQSHGWPTIALVGYDASDAAALVLIHSPDHDFQWRLIPQLQQLVEQKKIVGSDIATLIDKALVAAGKPQRFGTQFSWQGESAMVMSPVEDPAHLDQRRATYLLPPMDLCKRMLAEMYHRKV